MSIQQLTLLCPPVETIETIIVELHPDIPRDVFMACYRLSFYMELMKRVDKNHVVWDERVEALYSERVAEAVYTAMQNGWIKITMEIPKPFYDSTFNQEEEK